MVSNYVSGICFKVSGTNWARTLYYYPTQYLCVIVTLTIAYFFAISASKFSKINTFDVMDARILTINSDIISEMGGWPGMLRFVRHLGL